jgi:hypothetical protein
MITDTSQAVARHNEIAEGFSRALMEISANMMFGQRQGAIYPTPAIKQLVVKLYIKYFQFLYGAMTWYQSKFKRFKAAFNQKFYTDEVQKKVTKIKEIVNEVIQEASLETQGTIISMYDTTKAIRSRVNDLVTTGQVEEQSRSIKEVIEMQREDIAMQFRIADEHRFLSDRELDKKLDLFKIALGETVQKAMTTTIERLMYTQASVGMFPLVIQKMFVLDG